MRAFLIVLATLALATVGGADEPGVHAPEWTLTDVAKKIAPAVVHIEILDLSGNLLGTGTGFFVSSDGLIVTNNHVIEEAVNIRVTMSDSQTCPIVGVLAYDNGSDLAVIKAAGGPYVYLPLNIASIEPGEGIVVMGGPMGLTGSLSDGIISAIREGEEPGEPTQLQITAPISPGSSGSPVVNFGGQVVGVAVSIHRGGENLGFAIPAVLVAELLRSIEEDAAPKTFAGRKVILINLGISLLFFFAVWLAFRRLGKKSWL